MVSAWSYELEMLRYHGLRTRTPILNVAIYQNIDRRQPLKKIELRECECSNESGSPQIERLYPPGKASGETEFAQASC